MKILNQLNYFKCINNCIFIFFIFPLTGCQQIIRNSSDPEFRLSLSVSPYTELMFMDGYYFKDGENTAHSVEELQKMYMHHGSTEVYARFATKRNINEDKGGIRSHSQGLRRARLAKELNLPFNPEIGLFENYSDVRGQESPDFSDFPEIIVPGEWTSLNLDQMQSILYDYGVLFAKDVLSTGVTVNIWDIGNEVEFGVAGVAINIGLVKDYKAPDTIDPEIGRMNVTDFFHMPGDKMIAWLQQHIWQYTAKLFKAVSDGIKTVDPDARFSTHVSGIPATNPELAVAFFKAMNEGGYYPDELGMSYMPTNTEGKTFMDFQKTVTKLYQELGKKVFIAELGYPAGIMTGTFPWNAALEGYPLTDDGQAAFIRDLVYWGYESNMLSGIRPWAPDFLHPVWQPMSFFNVQNKEATARSGLFAAETALRQAKNSAE